MGRFAYEALDKGGRVVRGAVEAASEEVVIDQLRGMGFYPTRVEYRAGPGLATVDVMALPGIRLVMHRVKRRHIVVFTRQLATLLGAGLPILRSLNILMEQVESVVFRDRIQAMIRDVESGSTLSQALARHPSLFDELYVNMVRAGEIGGALESVLMRIATFLEKRHALRGKVKSAMMYPAVVFTVATAILAVIMWQIVPRFVAIFEQLGVGIPGLTRGLFAVSYFIGRNAWLVAVIGVAAYLIYRRVRASRTGRLAIDWLKLRLPVLGPIARKLAIARFAGTLATMVNAGVPILQSLDIVREASGNQVLARAVGRVHDRVREGDAMHGPMAESAIFPPMIVHMVAVGEETGAIDQMLEKVAEAYEQEVDDTVAALTSILEPILLVLLGCVIGVIVVALYLPLFTIVIALK